MLKQFLKNTVRTIAVVIGFAFLIGTLYCGLILPGKTAAVLSAWGGGISGALFLYLALRLFIKSSSDDEGDSKKIKEMKLQLEARKQEIERIEKQRIHVDGFRGMLRLSLGQIDNVFRDVLHRRYNEQGMEIDHKDPVMKVGEFEYIGCISKEFKVNLGVDLHKVIVKQEGEQIFVSNIETEWQGFEQLKTDWQISEIRRQERSLTSPFTGELVVRKDDPAIKPFMLEQDKQIQNRLNHGAEYQTESRIIRQLARQVISELLRPLGKQISFDETEPKQGQSLLDFIHSHNEKIASQVVSVRQAMKALPPPSNFTLREPNAIL